VSPGASPGGSAGSCPVVSARSSSRTSGVNRAEGSGGVGGGGASSVPSPRPSSPGCRSGVSRCPEPDSGSRRAWPMSLPSPAAVPRGGRRAMTTDGTSASHRDYGAHAEPNGISTADRAGVSPPGVRARAWLSRRVAPAEPSGRRRRDRRAWRRESPTHTPRRGPGGRCRPCGHG
jgi:hypothetical protein